MRDVPWPSLDAASLRLGPRQSEAERVAIAACFVRHAISRTALSSKLSSGPITPPGHGSKCDGYVSVHAPRSCTSSATHQRPAFGHRTSFLGTSRSRNS